MAVQNLRPAADNHTSDWAIYSSIGPPLPGSRFACLNEATTDYFQYALIAPVTGVASGPTFAGIGASGYAVSLQGATDIDTVTEATLQVALKFHTAGTEDVTVKLWKTVGSSYTEVLSDEVTLTSGTHSAGVLHEWVLDSGQRALLGDATNLDVEVIFQGDRGFLTTQPWWGFANLAVDGEAAAPASVSQLMAMGVG